MMHPVFATRRGTRPRGEANLLAIITSKHVSWSNGSVGRSAGRPASLEFVAPRFRACLLSSRTFQRERKMDGRGRKREGASNSIASCRMHAQALYGCEKASLPSPSLPSHPLTLRSRSGPWNPVLDIKQDQICRVAPPNRCMYAQDQVQSTGRRNHGITFVYYRSSCNRIRGIRGPTIFLADFFSTGSPLSIYMYIYFFLIIFFK